MRRILLLLLLTPVLLGCSANPTPGTVTGLIFQRNNASTWGDQLYLHLTPTQVVTVRYIPEGTSQLQTLEQLPLTQAQWQSILRELEQLSLERAKSSWLETLFPRQDGADSRSLTLLYGQQQITYRWPTGGEALEQLLEQLVQEVTP